MSNQITTPEPRLQCRHIMTSGHRCGSPCLRREAFCYYHHTTRKPAPRAPSSPGASTRTRLDLPLPEDRSAVQQAIGQVLQSIAEGKINSRRAALLLYGLQIASHNLAKALPQPPTETVELAEQSDDPALGLLAPESPLTRAPNEKSLLDLLTGQCTINEPEVQSAHSKSEVQT